jgi:hypothetical protein
MDLRSGKEQLTFRVVQMSGAVLRDERMMDDVPTPTQ